MNFFCQSAEPEPDNQTLIRYSFHGAAPLVHERIALVVSVDSPLKFAVGKTYHLAVKEVK